MRRFLQLTLTCLLTPILSAPAIQARSCETVDGAVSTILTPEDFAGNGTLTIDGDEYPLEVDGINFGFTETEDDGTQHAVTGTDWDLQGTPLRFTTTEDARLDPTDTPGVFLYVGRSRVITGRGRYNCGEMIVQGEVDFNTGLGEFPIIRGKLCRCN